MLFVFLFVETGCADWINVDPENSVTFENYFRSEKDAQSLLFYLEDNLRNMTSPFANLTEIHTEKDFDGNYLPLMMNNFERYYEVIAAADVIIDNAFRFPLPEETIRPYVLQAYFGKAVAYFGLATDFGEAPIIKDSQEYKKYAKSSVNEVLDEAEKWALLALELPKYEELKLGDLTLCKQYASKGAATALLAKIYAWRAGVEGKEEYWEKAEELCTQIIENKVGTYGLASDPETVCKDVLKGGHQESIWEFYRDSKEQRGVFYYPSLTNGIIGFPIDLMSTPLDNAETFVVRKETVRAFFDVTDLRREAYFWATDADSVFVGIKDGKTVVSTERENGVDVTGKYGNQGIVKAFFTKYRYANYVFYDWTPDPIWSGMDQFVVRYRLADIILLRAECRVRQNKTNAVEDLNRIRRRAYGDDSHAWPNAADVEKGLDKDMQLAIFREREKELFQEGHRYYDARRNGVEYVQRFFPPYATLSEQDILEGALYMGIANSAFDNNDLLRQNIYWNRRLQ